MADLSNNSSFIPKRGPVKNKRRSSSRQVYIFTLVSYVLIFATLIGAGGVYFYTQYIDKQLTKEISLLNSEINSFNEVNMQKVQDFDRRLQQASVRLDNSVSVVSVFEALEAATIDTVKIVTLVLERELDDQFLLIATLETDSFDSTIFQRGVYNRNKPTVETVEFSNLQTNLENETSSESMITLDAKIEIPLSEVPYVVSQSEIESLTITESSSLPDNFTNNASGSVDLQDDNQSDI